MLQQRFKTNESLPNYFYYGIIYYYIMEIYFVNNRHFKKQET